MNPYSFNLDKISGDRELKEDLIKLSFKSCCWNAICE